MQITIINRQRIVPVKHRSVEHVIREALTFLKSDRTGQITVVITNNLFIQKMNKRFLNKDLPTDVLSFDLSEGSSMLADIIVSAQKAKEHARIYKTTTVHELLLYVVHGVLHLFGFNDDNKTNKQSMHRAACQILKKSHTVR